MSTIRSEVATTSPPEPQQAPGALACPCARVRGDSAQRHARTPEGDRRPRRGLDREGSRAAQQGRCPVTLPYNQIPEDRRTIGDVTGRLDEHNGVLGVALAQWMGRDDSKAEPDVRQAANTAMEEIDAMLAQLHALRARLVSEIRASDDATATRVDALLGEASKGAS
jgi:hypothetical protein